MIIYGFGTKALGSVELTEGNCMKCGSPSLTLNVFQRYFHLIFIPFFPTKKIVEGKCRSCGKLYEQDDLPTYVEDAAASARRAASTPKILFIGLAIFLAIGIVSTIRDRNRASDARAYLASPKPKDLYVLPIGLDKSFKYMVCRLDRIDSDSLTFTLGEEGYMFSSGAEKAIDKGKPEEPEYFVAPVTYSKVEVKHMLQDEESPLIFRSEE